MRVPETLNLQVERPIPEYGVDFYFQSFFLLFFTLVHFSDPIFGFVACFCECARREVGKGSPNQNRAEQ